MLFCRVHFAVKCAVTLVKRVRPLYGPVAGGTQMTIAGQFLSVSTVTAVYIGQHQCFVDKYRYSFVLGFQQSLVVFIIIRWLNVGL